MMNREEYLKTIRREQAKPVPYFFCLCKAVQDKFHAKYGQDADYREFYQIPLREVHLRPTRLDPEKRFAAYWQDCDIPGKINEWGIKLKKSEQDHFFSMVGPLRNLQTPEAVEQLPFPDLLEDYRWEGVAQDIADLKARGYLTMVGVYGGDDIGLDPSLVPAYMDIFEASWYLCGLDNMLMSFYDNEEFAQALLDRMTDFKAKLAAKWAQAGIDILVTGDDVGTQKGMMMAPEQYRTWLKPRLKRVIDAAKAENPDILIHYHSDGNIEEIIDDLVEAGVEILNPIQPECMDPDQIIQKYRGRLSFNGSVGTQTTMPFASSDEVAAVCRARLELTKDTGGMILAPTHLIEPEVPIENVDAFVQAVREYNEE